MQSVSCWYWWKLIFNAATSTTTITYHLKIWMRPWPSNPSPKFRDYLCLCHSLLNIRTVASRGSPSSSRSKSYFLSLASFFKQLRLVARAATQSNWLPQLFPVFKWVRRFWHHWGNYWQTIAQHRLPDSADIWRVCRLFGLGGILLCWRLLWRPPSKVGSPIVDV